MKNILITGATGFVGSYLIESLLLDSFNKIYGTYFLSDSISILGDSKKKIELIQADLRKEEDVKKVIAESKPDYIYHLAAFTSPADSFSSPGETIINNIISQLNILEQLRKNMLKQTKILVVSSADVYGMVEQKNLPIDEDTPFNPTNPYAVSKLAQDYLGRQYFLTYGIKAIRVRPFNHIGPRQSANFVVSSFAKKIAEIEKGKKEPVLPVGNLEAKRDFTDVRDVVKAYKILMEKGEVGEVYNIGSGVSYKISDILTKLLSFSIKKITVQTDQALLRPSDNPELVCDNSKITKATGWKTTIPLEITLKDTLDYWRDIT